MDDRDNLTMEGLMSAIPLTFQSMVLLYAPALIIAISRDNADDPQEFLMSFDQIHDSYRFDNLETFYRWLVIASSVYNLFLFRTLAMSTFVSSIHGPVGITISYSLRKISLVDNVMS